jgi:hypothetical protein
LHEQPLLLDVNKKGKTEVIWTYDVVFQQSNIKWSTRWDTYLQVAAANETAPPQKSLAK